jgi:hypothetical protein
VPCRDENRQSSWLDCAPTAPSKLSHLMRTQGHICHNILLLYVLSKRLSSVLPSILVLKASYMRLGVRRKNVRFLEWFLLVLVLVLIAGVFVLVILCRTLDATVVSRGSLFTCPRDHCWCLLAGLRCVSDGHISSDFWF